MAEERKNRALYYHRYTPTLGSSQPPSYYSGAMPQYGGGAAYGGSTYGGASYGAAGQEDSAVGSLNLARIMRVCASHWMTIFVFFVLGLLGSFIVFKLLPTKYQAMSVFQMSIAPRSMIEGQIYDESNNMSMKEVFNTRLQLLRSEPVFKAIVERYRTEHASSTVTQEELITALAESEMELVPFSKLINLTVTSTSATLSMDLANTYAQACESYMHEQNRAQAENAVAWLTTMVDNQERLLAQREKELMDMRKERKLDAKQRARDDKQARMVALNAQLVGLDTQISKAKELMTSLKEVAKDPTKFGMVSESIPRSSEISTAYATLQASQAAYQTMLANMTPEHPDVKIKAQEVEVLKKQFAESLVRADETAQAEYAVLQRQHEPIEKESKALSAELINLDTDIISTEVALQQLERNCEIEREKVSTLRMRMSRAELKADEDAAIIQQVKAAPIPETPSSPKPFIIFPAGALFSLALGVFFVLLLDHMEDKLVDVSDIEGRLRLKVLALMPHLRRLQRAQIAKTTHSEPFSQYAEAMAGLRNMLDSPHFHDLSKVVLVMSTQPAEGKTCTSTNLAISYAQSGQKTLLVDFDMRRPRLATIFGLTPGSFESLPHTLARNNPELFATMPSQTDVPSLDLVASRASSSISPSVLMGTNIITEFFDWARQNYDHIVIDSPPFGLVGDVIVLANLVDSVLMVATPDKTRFKPINFAVRRLNEVGARLLGVIVNNVDYHRWAGFSKYESHYGYRTYKPMQAEKAAAEGIIPEDAVFAINPADTITDAPDTKYTADDDE